ncbi:MAG: transcriptional regulator [Flavobacterium sp. BFFFF2]|nr:MAG: transcriptional regulator [Flavobacterium sp. BFFFF2]
MFNDLDPILHSQLRLAIISILMGVEEAEFTAIKEMTKASAGNLSLQLDKLKENGYVTIEKSFKNKYPVTKCRITNKGILAFENYVKVLKQYLDVSKA